MVAHGGAWGRRRRPASSARPPGRRVAARTARASSAALTSTGAHARGRRRPRRRRRHPTGPPLERRRAHAVPRPRRQGGEHSPRRQRRRRGAVSAQAFGAEERADVPPPRLHPCDRYRWEWRRRCCRRRHPATDAGAPTWPGAASGASAPSRRIGSRRRVVWAWCPRMAGLMAHPPQFLPLSPWRLRMDGPPAWGGRLSSPPGAASRRRIWRGTGPGGSGATR